MSGRRVSTNASMDGGGLSIGRDGLPKEPRNRNVRCKGKSVIRYKQDGDGYRKDDPILDADGKRQYRPCEAFAANGTDWCGMHGGSAPQTIDAAKRTLASGAEEFAEALRTIANDERLPAETRLKAINSGLDRIGIRSGVDVSLEAPTWQKLMSDMFGATPKAEESEEVAPTEPAEETKPTRRAPARRKAAPPPARPKFEGW